MAGQRDDAFILLLGVEEDLFKDCFGSDAQWPCKLERLSEDCAQTEVKAALARRDLKSVVVQEEDIPHWDALVEYYNNGGTIVYFGIYGVYSSPSFLSDKFGLNWRFSAYTKYEYLLTSAGIEVLGDAIKDQQYTKSNLVHVPEEDRLMVPKVFSSYEEWEEDCCDSDDEDEDKRAKHQRHQEDLG